MIARRAPTMAEHYSKPSRRDERRKLIFGASYFRPGRRERRPERRNVNARAHARKPWEKILAPTSCANSSSFEASHYPPHPFSHPSLHLIDRWNVISLLPLDNFSFRMEFETLFVCNEFLNFFLPRYPLELYLLSISICKKRRIKKLWMKKQCKSDENLDRYLDRRNVHVVSSSDSREG